MTTTILVCDNEEPDEVERVRAAPEWHAERAALNDQRFVASQPCSSSGSCSEVAEALDSEQ